ncbi:PaaI family thioesterase [Bordetella sp. BOR01]|uniref:PaaI family thioesterase n=1 Tax=Bordetella sp. BOR01 TaxID=2854779 RepID=UPI001C43E3FA|nr:PaaI family thioesterase [Bordetella sp. BOR01]MBV7482751.1 PaaI family thioesterase [Bordetella sp. BOR01]
MKPRHIDIAAAEGAFCHARDTYEQAFGSFFLARLLGFELAYHDDCCRVGFEVRDFMFNPQGSLHGGIIALALDVSMGHFLNHLQGPAMTLEMKTQYLGAIRGGRVCAEGRLLRRGRGICFLESRLTDADGGLQAHATATWKFLGPAAGA